MHRGQLQVWITWSAIGVLAILCGAVAVLQYRWIGEISAAEQQRLRDDLHDRLEDLRRHFNDEIAGAAMDLQPDRDQIQRRGIRAAYEAQYRSWQAVSGTPNPTPNPAMFSRIALAERHGDTLNFYMLNPRLGTFSPANAPDISPENVPADWTGLRSRLEARAEGGRRGPPDAQPPAVPNHLGQDDPVRNDALIELPAFGPAIGDGPPTPGWLILEINLDYVRAKLLPEALRRYLATGGKLEYQVEVVARADPSNVIYKPGGEVRPGDADGEIALFDDEPGLRMVGVGRPPPENSPPPLGPGERRNFKKGPPQGRGKQEDRGKGRGETQEGFFGGRPPEGQPRGGPGGPGRWLLRVQHQSGSLEALVEQTRRRNLTVSAGLLILILATSAILVRYTRRMRDLAELQMNFVAGVSHELRTPLTVIRTAAFNLRRAATLNVEQYGTLIENESQKLSALVDQVLQFGSASNGQASRQSAPVSVEGLIDETLAACQPGTRAPGVRIEKRIAPDLPPMLADRVALRHALQNLIDNGLKYGAEQESWLGIFASLATDRAGRWIEIGVADRGPGIPSDEQSRIFEPFFRGQRAIDDQIHGTGLGLNLVRTIVEAQGGSIRLESTPGAGATFVIRIPPAAAPEGPVNEFTNSAG